MSHFDNQTPYVPTYPPALGSQKLMELEADNSYLKYLYPKITRQISEFVEEECDKMEYEGSLTYFPTKLPYSLWLPELPVNLQKNTPIPIRRKEDFSAI